MILLLAVAVAIPVVVRSRPGAVQHTPAAFSVLTAAQGYVQVSGDVRHPGIYPLTAKIMTTAVIEMAVPAHPIISMEPSAAGTDPVVNGEALQVSISGVGKAKVTRGSIAVAERLVLGIPLDLNTINETDLDKVPGIGPAMASRIVMHRQNNGGRMSVQDLLMVEGIGEKKFSILRNYF
ncbi:MAG: helix-hairpin-helix domain-containing protein [Desulfuromonadales bacterium]|nr:helix-hairpin-helix domain-containing protein [Desulfuromonadales bacterium]